MSTKPEIPPEAIERFRKEKGLSQQQLASMLNVGVASLARWEKGTKKPTGAAAAILAALISGGGIVGGVGLVAGATAGIAGVGLLGSGYAIYRLLKERFEGTEDK